MNDIFTQIGNRNTQIKNFGNNEPNWVKIMVAIIVTIGGILVAIINKSGIPAFLRAHGINI
jgi:hypothetical protein